MSAQESGGVLGENRGALSAEEVVRRLQELVDTRPSESPIPIEWAVSAHFLGEMSGLGCLTLRSSGRRPAGC